ncbi:MAG: GAF domain-containing protein [Spirochaetia bacterium]|nr:GAF domain-containing protein [Spirochaetia bacterium]
MTLGRRIASLFPSGRVRGWVFSSVFGLVVIGVYYLLQWLVPKSYAYYNETVTVLFIFVSVLILFPAREQLLRNLLERREYAALLGEDTHHIDFIARQFTMDTLIQEVFPDLMRWLNVNSGKIAVLDPGRRYISYYLYRNGHVSRTSRTGRRAGDDFTRMLRQRRSAVTLHDVPEDLRPVMKSLRAALVQPFLYRARLLGFLVLHEPPRNRFASRALDLFAGKAAVSIQNLFLTTRIIDSARYDQEFASAQKIRNNLAAPRAPRIPGYTVESTAPNNLPTMVEFLKTQEGSWYIAVLALSGSSSGSALVLAGVLGQLYSIILREKGITLNKVMNLLRKDQEYLGGGQRLEILLAEFRPDQHSMTLMVDGKDFHIRRTGKGPAPTISSGWRNFVELEEGTDVLLDHRDTLVLRIAREGRS